MNPFFNIRNNFSISTGNADLQAEFTDSFEVTSIYKIGKMSMNLGVFYRHTEDVVERIVEFEDNVSISRPENVGTSNTTGIEFNAKYIPANWVSFTNDFNSYMLFNLVYKSAACSDNLSLDSFCSRLKA